MIRNSVLLGLILSILAGSICLTGITPVNGVMFNPKEYTLTAPTTGSGSAGTGAVAVAAFFSGSASKGLGAFSGALARLPIYTPEHVEGIFSLIDGNPALFAPLPCGPPDHVGAAGIVISGSFKGDRVLVSGCVGTSSSDRIVISNCTTPYHCIDEFLATGTGIVSISNSRIIAGTVLATTSSGSGTAGIDLLYTAEIDTLASNGGFLGGGSFIGTTSDINKNNGNWTSTRASIQPGCTVTTQGVAGPSGSFPNQPVTTSATPTSCPPASLGPQTVTVTFVIGPAANPIFAGHGAGTAMAAIQNTR